MWIWTLNWNEIRKDLLVGSCPMNGMDLARIRQETGATAILSLQHDECLAHFGIDYEQQRAYGRRLGGYRNRLTARFIQPQHITNPPLH